MNNEPLSVSAVDLMKYLSAQGIDFTPYEHAPVFTVAESRHLTETIPGLHCRNLFVRDKKERMFLVVAGDDTPVDLRRLETLLDCGRLSFGSAERLWTYLGVRPGSVCPFAIINDKDQKVTIILDAYMMAQDLVCYHPMENDRSVTLTPAALIAFIESCGREPLIIDLNEGQIDAA